MIFINTVLLECIIEYVVSKYTIMYYLTMTVLLEYIDHSLQSPKMRKYCYSFMLYISHYSGVVTITRSRTERNAWIREIPILRNALRTS